MNNEERAAKMDSLERQWSTLSDKLSLDHLTSEVEALTTKLEEIPERVEALRKRGFAYHNDWEGRAESLDNKWKSKRSQARSAINRQRTTVRTEAKDIDNLVRRGRGSDTYATRAERELDGLERMIESAERSIQQIYSKLQSDASELEGEFYRAEYVLDSLDKASFQLHRDESGIAAVKAEWTSDNDEPNGILFLTDNRLIFEQREKKATKKVLFVTTKSELVQEKLWESPVGAIAEMSTKDKGVLKGKQFITFTFKERSRELPGDVTLQIKGMDNQAWVDMVNALQSGAMAKEHIGAVVETRSEEVAVTAPAAPDPKEIPTNCPACGAKLPVAYQGVRELTCDYCGNVVYL